MLKYYENNYHMKLKGHPRVSDLPAGIDSVQRQKRKGEQKQLLNNSICIPDDY